MDKTRYNRGTSEFKEAMTILLDIEDNLDDLQDRGFDDTFTNSITDFMSARDYLTDRQYDAVMNIRNRWLGTTNAR